MHSVLKQLSIYEDNNWNNLKQEIAEELTTVQNNREKDNFSHFCSNAFKSCMCVSGWLCLSQNWSLALNGQITRVRFDRPTGIAVNPLALIQGIRVFVSIK